jgi:asparagine synthase (glutamine-hydrolysing)
MLFWDHEHYLPDDLLVKMDIASMASGLEVRSPFLDHELVQLCASLPSEWKGNLLEGKKLLRELVASDLPPELLTAPKRGFSVPLAEWWRGSARDKIRGNLADLHPSLRSLMNHPYIMSLLDDHQQGRRNHAQRLWCLAVLNAWAWAATQNTPQS